MKENEILDAPNPSFPKKGIWNITFPLFLLITLFSIVKFPIAFFIAPHPNPMMVRHFLLAFDFMFSAIPFYIFIKKVNYQPYHIALVFIWASLLVSFSEYFVSIINSPLTHFYSYIFYYFISDFIPFSKPLDFTFSFYFLEYGFTFGGFIAIGVYYWIKNNNRWLLPLVGVALWAMCYFFRSPFYLGF